MEELKEENARLKNVVECQREEIESLSMELEAMEISTQRHQLEIQQLQRQREDDEAEKEEEEAHRQRLQQQQQQKQQQQQQQQQQEGQPLLQFSSPMLSKYDDLNYLSEEEKKDVKFNMYSRSLGSDSYYEGNFVSFNSFTRSGEEDLRRPVEFDGLTNSLYGTFLTPFAARYRFSVKANLNGHGKAQWYICCARKEDDIYNNEGNSDHRIDDEDAWKETVRKFDAKIRRHPLFVYDSDERIREAHVGIDCDKDFIVWTQLVILEGSFHGTSSQFTFEGRFIR